MSKHSEKVQQQTDVIIELLRAQHDRSLKFKDLWIEFSKKTGVSAEKTLYTRVRDLARQKVVVYYQYGINKIVQLINTAQPTKEMLKEQVLAAELVIGKVRLGYTEIPKQQRPLVLASTLALLMCQFNYIRYQMFFLDEKEHELVDEAAKYFSKLFLDFERFAFEQCAKEQTYPHFFQFLHETMDRYNMVVDKYCPETDTQYAYLNKELWKDEEEALKENDNWTASKIKKQSPKK